MKKKSNQNNRITLLITGILLILAVVFKFLPETGLNSNNDELLIPEYNDELLIPEYNGESIIVINNDIPFFDAEELEEAKQSYEYYGDLDDLGRCTIAVSSVSSDTMPKGEREELKIKPSGWKQAKYEGIIEDDFLYNRCHLIAYCLTSENNNRKNLITGTHYMNENMNIYEVLVASYLDCHQENHVLYRATPIFEGDNLVAKGILLEGQSIEDDEISFCVFVYNIQPGIIIDYSDGSSQVDSK